MMRWIAGMCIVMAAITDSSFALLLGGLFLAFDGMKFV